MGRNKNKNGKEKNKKKDFKDKELLDTIAEETYIDNNDNCKNEILTNNIIINSNLYGKSKDKSKETNVQRLIRFFNEYYNSKIKSMAVSEKNIVNIFNNLPNKLENSIPTNTEYNNKVIVKEDTENKEERHNDTKELIALRNCFADVDDDLIVISKKVETGNIINNIEKKNNTTTLYDNNNYSLEIILDEFKYQLCINLNHNLYAWKKLSKFFSNRELDECNSIWKNHSLVDKYILLTDVFFNKMKKINNEEQTEENNYYIDVGEKSIRLLFENGIKKNEITMKLEDYKLSFNDLLKAEEMYIQIEKNNGKKEETIRSQIRFISDYERHINRLRSDY